MRRSAAVLCACLLGLILAAAASADPTGSKNSFTGTATCDNGMPPLQFVVNSSNGSGAGSQKNNTAEWAPAQFIASNGVFHPTVFNLTFTFTPAGGPPQSFPQQDTRNAGKTQTTCTLSGSQTDPAGDTFSISGTVSGWIS